MTELRRIFVRQVRVGVALTIAALTLLLTACPGPIIEDELKPKITLSADRNAITGSGNVTLTVEVLEGRVDSVTFKANKGPAIPPVTSPNSAGDFVTTVTLSETTTFTATATGPGGSTTTPTSDAETVTVTPATDLPRAPSSTSAVKGIAGIALTTGTPTELSAVVGTIPGVTGQISGQVKAETVKSARGLDVTILEGDGVLVFSYPAATVGKDSFEYTVTKPGAEQKGKIDLDVQALPGNVKIISDFSQLDNKEILLLKNEITCTKNASVDNVCIRLNSGQKLLGSTTEFEDDLGVTLVSPNAKIIANISGTRASGTPSGSGSESKVIILADNVTIEGLEITSNSGNETNAYFTAMYGRSFDSDALDGIITIKNVTISKSNGKPIYIEYRFPPSGRPLPAPAITFGNYNFVIEGLDLKDANDTLVIGNPTTLTFKNSKIELLQPSGAGSGPNEFGDNAGVQIANYINGNIEIDNVDVYMESTEYRIDNGSPGNNAVPFEIFSDSYYRSSTISLIVKNSDVTFGNIPSGSDSAAFKVKTEGGTININEGASINNTSKEGSSNAPGINRIGNVSGTIQFN